MRDLFGDGIFAADGDKWLAQRKTASHMFAAREFREVTLPPLAALTQLCLLLDSPAPEHNDRVPPPR